MGWISELFFGKKKAEVMKACNAHILDPVKGQYTENASIPEDVYNRFKDEKGDVYLLSAYDAGKPNTSLVEKQRWLQAAAAFAEIEQEAATATKEMMATSGQLPTTGNRTP
jgi:hypothetical protein